MIVGGIYPGEYSPLASSVATTIPCWMATDALEHQWDAIADLDTVAWAALSDSAVAWAVLTGTTYNYCPGENFTLVANEDFPLIAVEDRPLVVPPDSGFSIP